METSRSSLNDRIAARARSLRLELGLSLEALASQCGVSRSMLSLIERGEASPTAVVLERLSVGLGVPLASLFDPAKIAVAVESQPVSRAIDQLQWRDPASGYMRRNVSPPAWPSPITLVDIDFPPGARVAYETGHREPTVHQQVWVIAGRIEISLGEQRYDLGVGDCLAMILDRPVGFANRTRKPARYLVAIHSTSSWEPP